jgi:large subunit ribosomal protein L32e
MTEPLPFNAKKALKLRARAKKKKPNFVRPESWRYFRLKESWRRPQGLDHKMRLKIKGWPKTVEAGYRGPAIARGLHPSGRREILIHNPDQLAGVDPKTQAVRIAHTVGMRKRARIISDARRRRLKILNVKETVKPLKEEKPSEKSEEKAKQPEESEEAKTEQTQPTEEEKPEAKAEAKPRRRKRRMETK